jgi:ribose transport system substrate-binding protein
VNVALKSMLFSTALSAAMAMKALDPVAAAEAMKLGLSMPTLNTPFFTVLVKAATAEAEKVGGTVVQTTNANRDASQQVNAFRNLINAGANVILAGVVDRAAIKPARSTMPRVAASRSSLSTTSPLLGTSTPSSAPTMSLWA